MDPLHIHLILNHVPVIGMAGALVLLAWGLGRRSSEVIGAALAAMAIVALLAIPVYLTGESAEARVEGLPGVSNTAISTHEDIAVAAFVGVEMAGALAAIALATWLLRRRFLRVPVVTTLLVGAIAMALVVRAASFGGQIRHTELGGNAVVAPAAHSDDD